MEEDFTTYEQALVLKELGFNNYCDYRYSDSKELYRHDEFSEYFVNEESVNSDLFAPTLYQAHRWLYKTFGLLIVLSFNNTERWCFIIKHIVTSERTDYDYNIGRIKKEVNFTTPEEALSKAISECLKFIR